MLKRIIVYIPAFLAIFLAHTAFAALSCTVANTCSNGVVVLRMASTVNSHAELPSQNNYSELVCCSGATGLSNSCSGNYEVVARLSGDTNAHVEENTQSTATYDGHDACLSVSSGSVTVDYQDNNCNGFDTTVFSMGTATTNSHVGDASSYTRKVCATVTSSGGGGGGGGSGSGGSRIISGHIYPVFAAISNSIISGIKDLIPSFLKPTPTPNLVINYAPDFVPYVFRGIWSLLPEKAINRFALAPLPRDIQILAAKFPVLAQTLHTVGVEKFSDLNKIQGVNLKLPGLTERATLPTVAVQKPSDLNNIPVVGLKPVGLSGDGALPTSNLAIGKFSLPAGIPLAKLSASVKKNIPSEFVFVREGGELVDLGVTLSLNDQGNVEQKISTIQGRPLHLVIKPDGPVHSVEGYLVFKAAAPKISRWTILRDSLLASSIFAIPDLAENVPAQSVPIEERLVLSRFEYTDPDHDGIYTADIIAPVVAGEYEVITILDYVDPALGRRQVRLTTVVDPEGYVFEKNGDKETRIPKAVVTLSWLNSLTNQYEIWSGKQYSQENPQTTDVSGTYSFLVPEGTYKIDVVAPDYQPFHSKEFVVTAGSGIHTNIELKTRYAWLKVVDYKVLILIIIIVLLVLNFYRDRNREKFINNQ